MKSPFLPLHQAQRDRIVAETGFKVFDDFPGADVAMPYVIMGEVSGRDWSDKFEPGQEVFSTVHIWSQYPGRKEAAEMQDAILQALTSSPLDLGPGFYTARGALDMSEMIIDIDGTTRHGIVRMKYLIEEL